MATREFKGNAVVTALSGGISPADTTINIVASTNWPSGAGAKQFVVLIISADGATREKVLIESRATNALTVATAGRGYDGTSPQTFITGASIIHVADAVWMQTIDDHTHDVADDHLQYLNATRHGDSALHVFGAALAAPGAPEDIGTSPSPGISDAPARGDHHHQLGAASIDSSTLFVDGVVTTAKIADNAIIPGKLDVSVMGPGLGMTLGIAYVKTDGTTCQINGSGQIQVLGGVVSTGGIADNAITLAKMADASVGSIEIIDGSVTVTELADGAVTTPKLLDASVTKAKLDPAIGRGLQGFASKTTSQTGITTETTVTGLSVTSQPETATRYRRVHFRAQNVGISGGAVTDAIQIKIKRGTTVLGIFYRGWGVGGVDIWAEDDDAPIAAHVYTVTVTRQTGAGTVNVDAVAGGPAILEVHDIGGH